MAGKVAASDQQGNSRGDQRRGLPHAGRGYFSWGEKRRPGWRSDDRKEVGGGDPFWGLFGGEEDGVHFEIIEQKSGRLLVSMGTEARFGGLGDLGWAGNKRNSDGGGGGGG